VARIIFDVIVMAMSAISLVACIDSALQANRVNDRRVFWLASFCSALFILCQSSWVLASAAGVDVSPEFTNWLWDVFNASVMITFITLAWTRFRL